MQLHYLQNRTTYVREAHRKPSLGTVRDAITLSADVVQAGSTRLCLQQFPSEQYSIVTTFVILGICQAGDLYVPPPAFFYTPLKDIHRIRLASMPYEKESKYRLCFLYLCLCFAISSSFGQALCDCLKTTSNIMIYISLLTLNIRLCAGRISDEKLLRSTVSFLMWIFNLV